MTLAVLQPPSGRAGVSRASASASPEGDPSSVRARRRSGVNLRSPADIDAIARAGAVVAAALREARLAAVPGATTLDIDATVRRTIRAYRGARPSFLHYPGASGACPFPAACCISVNEEVVHGIPGRRVLCTGDLVSIDVGVELYGWFADAAITVLVTPHTGAPGAGTEHADRAVLVACAERVLHSAIRLMQPGRRWSDIAARMQGIAIADGFGMVDGWMGHGVGRAAHEAPQVPCMVTPGLREYRDFTLLPGMVLAVEPLLVLGGGSRVDAEGCAEGVPVEVREDGWTVAVADGRPAAHVEHTVAVTAEGPRILTVEPTANEAASPAIRMHGGGSR